MIENYFKLAILLAFQAPSICLIACTYIFVTLKRNGLTRLQFILIRLLAVGCLAFTLCELLPALINYEIIDWPVNYIGVLYNITYTLLLTNTIFLSEFCISKISKKPRVILMLIRALYFVVFAILLFRFFSNNQLFTYFAADGTILFGPLDDLQSWGCTLIYIHVIVVLLINYKDKNQYAEREANGKLLLAIIFIASISIIYLLTYIPYIVWISYMLVVAYLYISIQKLMVYSDELTSLNNRRRMILDIRDLIENHKNWRFIIFDLNSFKQINDKYGHNEGDEALTTISKILEGVSIEYNFKAYRYGGDEFGAVLTDKCDLDSKTICERINEKIDEYNKNSDKLYKLSVSCGYAEYGENSIEDIHDIIELADKRMYEEKNKR